MCHEILVPGDPEIRCIEPGDDQTACGPQCGQKNAGASIAVMDLVYLGSDSEWYKTDADAIVTSVGQLAIALETKGDGQAMRVALPGCTVRNDAWNWTPGAKLYADGSVVGGITQTVPPPGSVARVIGFALTDDCILFNPATNQKPGYTLQVLTAQSSVNDGGSYYPGCSAPWGTIGGIRRVYIPKSGVIRSAYISWSADSVAGSNENISVYIRKNNSTDTLIQTVGNTAASKQFINTSLAISVAAGDYIEVKIVCPTWVTNPTAVTVGGTIYIEPE